MDFLETVARERLADAVRGRSTQPDVLERVGRAPAPRAFAGALRARRASGRFPVIAEVKRRSPALGALAAIADPGALAAAYARAGAAAISVLTEPRHWGGSLEDVARVREAVDLPVLAKDVIVDPHQLAEARAAGADAVLLIAEVLDEPALERLVDAARALGLETLVEAHEPEAFARAARQRTDMLGVNARDLRAPERLVPERVRELVGQVPDGAVLVAESGIRSAADVRALPPRVDAGLVGSALVSAPDPGALLHELASAEPGSAGA